MKNIYSKPLRVYLILAALALWGILCGIQLPISLFPQASKPTIFVSLSYGSFSSQQFFETIGRDLEARLHAVKSKGIAVDTLKAHYADGHVNYNIQFDWGADSEEALKNVESLASASVAHLELSIRRSLSVNYWSENKGFLAISFYSPLRSLDDLYDLLLPLTTPISTHVPDANGVSLFNPSSKEINIQLSPEKMAVNHLSTTQVESVIRDSLQSLNAGNLKIGEKNLTMTLPHSKDGVESLKLIRLTPIYLPPVLLKDIADISINIVKESQKTYKTSGVESLILFAEPKEGGNIKRMADDIMSQLDVIKKQIPADVQFQILVNPSDFINQSIFGVIREVLLAAFLAVIVLFLFLGSFKNVATAAIEIPLSLVMAFILMKLTGMNLNLISLGGLALSAGMNVDASVVVLENIFRHFEKHKKTLSYHEKVMILVEAVKEVQLPIIASTVASLVVFAPLVFTQGLTNSLLGDLAKAVLFSHGLSAIVALILVPTIRLQLMKKQDLHHSTSPIEKYLVNLEKFYHQSLNWFLLSTRAQILTITSVLVLIPIFIYFSLPNLKKEIIGRPETDWLIVGIYSPVMTSAKEMESEISVLEEELLQKFSTKVKYTFTQIMGANNGFTMLRLNSRHEVDEMSKQVEELYKNTPTKFYFVEKWNPSELDIPQPPDMKLEIVGGQINNRHMFSEDLVEEMNNQSVFDNIDTRPSIARQKSISIHPTEKYLESAEVISKYDLSHYLRTAVSGLYVDDFNLGIKSLPIILRIPESRTSSLQEIQALPIGFEDKLLPIGSLAHFDIENKPPDNYRVNQISKIIITGKMKKVNEKDAPIAQEKAKKIIEDYKKKITQQNIYSNSDLPAVNWVNPDTQLQDALEQLKIAVLISTALVFLTMVIQLGDIVQALLVMVSIPLGFLGVLISLTLFKSTLSLNSGLGTILLNGIAVANSIILVDFIHKLYEKGMTPLKAATEASTTRLRPILMTSLTTVLGMLPVALGLGEGGKILQPLGIAVCGGLWVSALMTLYIVPALQYQYLLFKDKKQPHFSSHENNEIQIKDKTYIVPEKEINI